MAAFQLKVKRDIALHLLEEVESALGTNSSTNKSELSNPGSLSSSASRSKLFPVNAYSERYHSARNMKYYFS